MNARLKTLLYLFSFVIIYAFYYWGLPALINIKHNIFVLENIVNKELGIQIKFKNPQLKMGLVPSVWINADEFNVLDANTSPLTVKNPKLKIRLFPLVIGKIQPSYFSCDKLDLNIKVDKHLRLYLGNILFIEKANPKLSFEDMQTYIQEYNIFLNDEFQGKNILFSGDYFNLYNFNSKKNIKLSTNSKIKVNNKTSVIDIDLDFKLPFKKSFETKDVVFDGTVTNLDLGIFAPYIKKFTKERILNTQGLINIETKTKILDSSKKRINSLISIQGLKIIEKDKPSSIIFDKKLDLTAILDVSRGLLNINKFKIKSDKIDTEIFGEIQRINAQNPTLNLNIIVEKSRIEDLISLIPTDFNIKEVNLYALKKYGYYSDIQGNLSIRGRADRPNLKGKIISTNAYVIKPLPLHIPKAIVSLDFLGEKFFLDVFVPCEKAEHVSVKGDIYLYDDKKTYLDITSTKNVNLKTAQIVLNPIHEIFQFDLGPLPVMDLHGFGNINLKTAGTKANPSLFGVFNFRDASVKINGLEMLLTNANGKLEFKNANTYFETSQAYLNNKPAKVKGTCTLSGELDYSAVANGQDLGDLIYILKNSPILGDMQKQVSQLQNGKGKIDFTLKLSGKVKSINDFKLGKNVFVQGTIKLFGNNASIQGLSLQVKSILGTIKYKNTDLEVDLLSNLNKSKVKIEGKIDDNNAKLNFKSDKLYISDIIDVLPSLSFDNFKYISTNSNNYINLKASYFGPVNKIDTDKISIYGKTKINNVKFTYLPQNLPVNLYSGVFEIKGNTINLYKINTTLDSVPLLVDGTIYNIFKNPNFNIYVNSKPNQTFIDKYINTKAIYPVKIKGDITFSSKIQGTKKLFSTKSEINLQDGANIYYMGSALGDSQTPIKIFLNADIAPTYININNFQYDKLISSQNGKEFVQNQLSAKGLVDFNRSKKILLENFYVKTSNPTDAKIFNMIFRKPLIKQGQFTSDIAINGDLSRPRMIGDLDFTGIDIPLLDTTVKDISLDFFNEYISIKAIGEIFSNKILLESTMKNKLEVPYTFNEINVTTDKLDINAIAKSISNLQIESDKHKITNENQSIDLSNLIINNAQLKATNVLVKNVQASNLIAKMSLDEKMLFSLDEFSFDLGEGKVKGNFNYNLLNSKSKLNLNFLNVNANQVAESLFDLSNQIYGKLKGEAEIMCNAKSEKLCMETISGQGWFEVANGKMPKLGSLEYLLRASNVVKSGITGLSINNIIDLLTPLKTGHFDNINGNFDIDSGFAKTIQIYSKGKDLSLYLTGTYNFSTLIADMNIFGKLSKKISTVLGPVGNASLNSVFNAIPGISIDEAKQSKLYSEMIKIPDFELNDELYRIFTVKIYGDINGENYVQSFKWVE